MALIRVPSRRLLQTTTGLLLQLMAFARRREPLLLGMCQNAGSAIWLPAASPLATCAHTYTPRAFLVVHYSAATAPCHEVGRRRRRGHSIRGSALGEGLAPILDAPAALVCCRRCSVLALCCSSPAEPGGGRIAETQRCAAPRRRPRNGMRPTRSRGRCQLSGDNTYFGSYAACPPSYTCSPRNTRSSRGAEAATAPSSSCAPKAPRRSWSTRTYSRSYIYAYTRTDDLHGKR